MAPPDGAAPDGGLRILRIFNRITPTGAPWNQFTRAWRSHYGTTVCTFFRSTAEVEPGVRVVEGDDTVAGFLRRLRGLLREGDHDVIHVHTPHLAVLTLLAVFLESPAARSRLVYTVHSSYPNYRLVHRALLLPVLAFFPVVVCCSASSERSLPGPLRRLAGDRLRVIRNGFDAARVERAVEGHVPSGGGPFTLAAVGRLIPAKRPLDVVEAFGRMDDPEAELRFVGDGPLREAVRARADALGVGHRVSVTGLVERDEVYRILLACDALVSASRVEGMPIAVLEAMACSRPVVLSAIPPHREIAGDLAGVPLVPVGDVERLAAEMGRLAAMPAAEREAVGAACRARALSAFGLEGMREEYDACYRAVAAP